MFREIDVSGYTFENLILSPENKAKIGAFIRELQGSSKLAAKGFRPTHKILMYGAPGSGKSTLSKILANQFKIPYYCLDISEFTGGDISKLLSETFEKIKEMRKPVVFMLDECDSIAWTRDSLGGTKSDSREYARATNVLFQCIDELPARVIFLAATNMKHRLDPAFVRRFEVQLEFDIDTDLEANIKRLFPKTMQLDMESKEAAMSQNVRARYKSSPVSYATLGAAILRASKEAVLRDEEIVHIDAIYKEVGKTLGIQGLD